MNHIQERLKSEKPLPLVTVVLYALNEEKYVADAVSSILGQTYPEIEVVLSDDGSTDRTFEIMQEMAAAYEGPHTIILNRNERNIGIGSQLNAAVRKSCGELIVLANADDISSQDRVAKLVNEWLYGGDIRATAIGSSLRQIGPRGEPLGVVMNVNFRFQSLSSATRDRFGGPGAACLAVDRAVFDKFGPLPDHLLLEDTVLLAWAFLLGPIRYVEEPLVDYRVHDDNISQTYAPAPFEEWRMRTRKRTIWHKREGIKAYIEILRSLQGNQTQQWDEKEVRRSAWIAMEKMMENAILHDYYSDSEGVSDLQRFGSLFRLFLTIVKARIKRLLPMIEKRNEKWHYRQILVSRKGRA